MDIVNIYKIFPTSASCIEYLEKVRWKNKPQCPYCKSHNHTQMPKEHRHHCNNCNTSYSVTVGTVLHKTKLDLQIWFLCINLMIKIPSNLSTRQLAINLNVNKNTAWYMVMRIRKAMLEDREFINCFLETNEL